MNLQELWENLSEDVTTEVVQAGLLQLAAFIGLLVVSWVVSRIVVWGLLRLLRGWFPEIDELPLRVVRRVAALVVYIAGAAVGFGLIGISLSAVAEAFRVLNYPLWKISNDSHITLMTPVAVVLVWIITAQVSRLMQRAVAQTATVRGVELDEGSIAVFQRLIHYIALTVGIFIALQVVGIDISALLAAGAVFAVGVGLAMQNLAQNFVSGVLLLVERSIKPGDVVEVEGKVVQVRTLGIRSTIARTRDGEDYIIPNSNLVQNPVKNLTHADRRVRVRMPVGVTYDSDMAKVLRVLTEAARSIPWSAPGSAPIVLWTGFGSSSVDFEVSVWGTDPWRLPQLRTEVARAVWEALQDAGITIAFPQVDVHFDAPVEEALRLVSDGRPR